MAGRDTLGDDYDELLGDFLDESSQLIQRLNEDLLTLDHLVRGVCETAPDDDLMNRMFRSAHSIKGLSAMLGLENINTLTHNIEHVFDAARRDELRFDAHSLETIFQAVDRLSAMIDHVKSSGQDEIAADDALAAIHGVLAHCATEKALNPAQLAALHAMLVQHTGENSPAPSRAPVEQSPVATTAETLLLAELRDEPAAGEYLAIFLDEAEATLDRFNEHWLRAEETNEAADWSGLLVAAHRLKGSAAAVGLHRAAKLAHLMEDLFESRRQGDSALSPDAAESLLHAADALRRHVQELRQGQTTWEPFADCAQRLQAAVERLRGVSLSTAQPNGAGESSLSGAAPTSLPDGAWSALLDAPTLASIRDHGDLEGEVTLGRIRFEPMLPLAGMKARLACEKLSHLADLVYCDPPLARLGDVDTLDSMIFALAGAWSEAAVRDRLRISGIVAVELLSLHPTEGEAASGSAAAPTSAPPDPPSHSPPAALAARVLPQDGEPIASLRTVATVALEGAATNDDKTLAKPTETMRVEMERLDQLMNLSGQLAINRACFSQIAERLKSATPGKQTAQVSAGAHRTLQALLTRAESSSEPLDAALLQPQLRQLQQDLMVLDRDLHRLMSVRSGVGKLLEAVHQLDRLAVTLQKTVMDTRMAPIGPLFNRFKRVVRDMTRNTDKDVRLVLSGEKTELDKRMIDELGDPLIHLVRNALDHGLETRQERLAAGKPPGGELRLAARRQGNSILIEISDDGRGLSREKILRKAIERGVIDADESDFMSDSQVFQLIWRPGFSTADEVTQISGRGMGMDIVYSKVEELHGVVETESRPGHGTTFTIHLPLTLAILPALLAQIDGEVFALPVESVVEIVRVEPSDLRTIYGAPTATIRDRTVAVARLPELFGKTLTTALRGPLTLVVLGADGEEIGIPVDRLIGEQDVVIKSLAENYRHVPGVCGASILGDGRVSLILDPVALVQAACA